MSNLIYCFLFLSLLPCDTHPKGIIIFFISTKGCVNNNHNNHKSLSSTLGLWCKSLPTCVSVFVLCVNPFALQLMHLSILLIFFYCHYYI